MSTPDSTIAKNKKAFFDYTIHERFEAGIVLDGWEVKALRLGRCQLVDSHAIIRHGEIFLLNAKVQAPSFASRHLSYSYEDSRTRKLLLKRSQIDKIEGLVARQGFTLVPLRLYWTAGQHLIKCELALVSGKNKADKRETIKQREWEREKHRVLKVGSR